MSRWCICWTYELLSSCLKLLTWTSTRWPWNSFYDFVGNRVKKGKVQVYQSVPYQHCYSQGGLECRAWYHSSTQRVTRYLNRGGDHDSTRRRSRRRTVGILPSSSAPPPASSFVPLHDTHGRDRRSTNSSTSCLRMSQSLLNRLILLFDLLVVMILALLCLLLPMVYYFAHFTSWFASLAVWVSRERETSFSVCEY